MAESGVTFVDLVRATLRRGLVPIIVPELKTITVGGAVSGCSIATVMVSLRRQAAAPPAQAGSS